jgi:Spy/CpxP family protein refolding chaperone
MSRSCPLPSGMYDGSGRVMMNWMSTLGLDEKQMAEIKEVNFKTMKETIKKKAEMDVAEVELRELFLNEPADFEVVEAKVRQIETLRGDIYVLQMREQETVRSMLTPAQRRKFDLLAMMPLRMTCGTDGRGLRGIPSWGMGRCLMMDGGMMQMLPDYEDGPGPSNEMGQDEIRIGTMGG